MKLLRSALAALVVTTPAVAGIPPIPPAAIPAYLLPTAATVQVPNGSPVNVIYDDDCTNDSDCNILLAALHHWIDQGQVNVLAFIADDSNVLEAPYLNIQNVYYHHAIPIGAYLGSLPANAGATTATSAWLSSVVTRFNPGDTRANYPSCVTVYRTVLAAAAPNSVVISETGLLTCVSLLMQSAADGISSQTGAQLIKAKVISLDIMGGYSAGGTEFNMTGDPGAANYVFANWTSANGYPPIYDQGAAVGNSILSGLPPWLNALTNPSAYGMASAGLTNRPSWDLLSLTQAVFGNSTFTLGTNGTNTVNATTGANTFSTGTASGQYFVTLTNAASTYTALFDGQTTTGAAFYAPQQVTPTLTTPGMQCSQAYGCAVGPVLSLGESQFYNYISGAYVNSADFIDPSLVAGQSNEINVGVKGSNNNWATFGFDYVGAGLATNYMRFGFYGSGDYFRIYANGLTQMPTVLTVATLPTCTTALKGSHSAVSDATSPTYLGTLTGSGTVVAPVFCNGAAWVAE